MDEIKITEIKLAGATDYGDSGIYHCASSGIAGDKLYLNRRYWYLDGRTSMHAGYAFISSEWDWGNYQQNFKLIGLTGIPQNMKSAHPVVLLRNNRYEIFLWLHGNGLVRYVKGESDNGTDFKIVNFDRPCLYHVADAAINAGGQGLLTVHESGHAAPDDGRTAAERQRLLSNDATSVFFDEPGQKYVMYSVSLLPSSNFPERRVAHDNAAEFIRVIHRRQSVDGLTWSDASIVLFPDSADPVDLQFYSMPVAPVDDYYVGLLGYYPAGAQTLDLELAVSTDNQNWQRLGVWKELRRQLSLAGREVNLLFPGFIRSCGPDLLLAATCCSYRHNQVGKLLPHQYLQNNVIIKISKQSLAERFNK